MQLSCIKHYWQDKKMKKNRIILIFSTCKFKLNHIAGHQTNLVPSYETLNLKGTQETTQMEFIYNRTCNTIYGF